MDADLVKVPHCCLPAAPYPKWRNLFAQAPERLHDEITADYNDMIYATTPEEIETRRKAFIRKCRLKTLLAWRRLEIYREHLASGSISGPGLMLNGLRRGDRYFFMLSFDIASSFFMPSFDIAPSFFMPSFDIASSFFMPSLDIVSLAMPSLPILSCAKAAGAEASPSEKTRAEIRSGAREFLVMFDILVECCQAVSRHFDYGA
jgi:hypothetical protein